MKNPWWYTPHQKDARYEDWEKGSEETIPLYREAKPGQFAPRQRGKMAFQLLSFVGTAIGLFWILSNVFSIELASGVSFFLSTGEETPVIFQMTHEVDFGVSPVASQLIEDHVFGRSWYTPFVGQYTPPDVDFNRVVLSMDASVDGTQFDRLSHFFVGGVEVWRPSTAEPGGRNVSFGFTKDVSPFIALFKSPQPIVHVLRNIVDETYTGPIVMKIRADFYNVPEERRTGESVADSYRGYANEISPLLPDGVSTSQGHIYSLPNDDATIKIKQVPKNTTKAVINVFASGNGEEEFWYANVFSEYSKGIGFGEGGHGPSRSVSVFVNDILAGFAYPFPIIYTGGISPAFWNPVVGTNAYDVPSYDIDITPLLPILWEQDVSIKIEMDNGDGNRKFPPISQDWLVTASILSWQAPGIKGSASDSVYTFDSKNKRTKIGISVPGGRSLNQIYSGSRAAWTNATLKFDNGEAIDYSWSQKGSLNSVINMADRGAKENIANSCSGRNIVTVNGTELSDYEFSYPLVLGQTLAKGSHSYNMYIARSTSSHEHVSGEFIWSAQNGSTVSEIDGHRFLGGSSKMDHRYKTNLYGNDYSRRVKAENGTIYYDEPMEDGDWANYNYLSRGIDSIAEINVFASDEDKSRVSESIRKLFESVFEGYSGYTPPVVTARGLPLPKYFKSSNRGHYLARVL
ncbi:hypothetical protein TRVA0_082S00166 [Trichomonascus vanleenenianus]|uniref:uncharacterized protein n=1 Tax=Trichomonascus vanleenenianus TaxID=2268995 RepID=UPI003EC9EAA6